MAVPSRDLNLPPKLLQELQILTKGTVSCGVLGTEVTGHCPHSHEPFLNARVDTFLTTMMYISSDPFIIVCM